MNPPQQPRNPHEGYYPYQTWAPYQHRQPARRNRMATWDVICTSVASVVLFFAAAAAAWLSLFFAFAADACPSDGCQPVPYHVDAFIYPVTWGGIGVALLVGAVGPFISVRRRWRMFVWSLTAVGIVIASLAAGFAMTAYCARYWH